MKKHLKRLVKRAVGIGRNDRARRSWMSPVQTIQPRLDTLDMAICNIQIGTRVERLELDRDRQRALSDRSMLLGDYAEFGVFQGNTFSHVFHRAKDWLPWMRFFAFDSFQGLPAPTGHDAGGEFLQGQFCCSHEDFLRNLRANEVDMARTTVVPGWFHETLTPEFKQEHNLQCVSIAYIDCDLYESCVPVLEFLSGLVRQGTLLFFDDWFTFKGDPDKGVQRASSEWLAANPHIHLAPWHTFSHHGLSFVVSVDR